MSSDLQKLTKIENQLETLIDAHGVDSILESIGIVCRDKADHIRSNWQDNVLAGQWERVAKKIDDAANYAGVRVGKSTR